MAKNLTTPEQVRAAVRELAAEGADCIEVFPALDAQTYVGLRDEAKAHGLPVVGHMVNALGLEDARMDDIQHLTGVPDGPSPGFDPAAFERWFDGWNELDERRIALAIEVARRDGSAHTPTLLGPALRAFAGDSAAPILPDPALLPAWYGASWGRTFFRRIDAEAQVRRRAALARELEVVRQLHAAGVPVLTGSDMFVDYLVPGAALQQEPVLLTRAGFSAEEGLAAATLVPGERFGFPLGGAIAPGARADLAIYAQDPTRDLANLATLEAVVVNGRLYLRSELEALHARQLEARRALGYRAAGAAAGLALRTLRSF